MFMPTKKGPPTFLTQRSMVMIGISLASAAKDGITKDNTGKSGGDLSNIFGRMLQNTGKALASKAKGNTNELYKIKAED